MSNDTQPEIRFPGFTEDWEERKFFDNIKSTIDFRGRTPKKLGMDWSTSGYLALSALNVKNGYIDPSADAHYGDQELYNKWMSGKELYEGQVLFTTEAPMGNVAQVPDNNKYILSQRTIAFDVNSDKITDDFLAVLLRSPKSFNELSSLASGGTAKGVSQKSLSQFKVTLPNNLEEQKKIGTFFKQLDDTIALHQRKLDLLKETKKGFLQKMFPKNGAKVPEVRFPGFTEDWEQRKLGELATIVRGASPRPIQDPKWFDTESDVGWLRIADVTEQDGRIYYLEQHISKLGQEKTRVLVEPHLLLSIAATVGKPVVNYVKTGVHDGFLIFLNAIFDREFMFQWLEMFRPKWQKYGQPGSQVNLNSELVRNQEILIPNNEEQQKIGSFFKQLDDTIALHQRELDLLKETKKGFLQKMFV
ncbi:TPA: restriction endonuclease subunit S [Enterococcus faecium]